MLYSIQMGLDMTREEFSDHIVAAYHIHATEGMVELNK